MYYLNYFFIFSIIGHFLEQFIYYNGESGILYGYWTPIYGIGVITIIFLHNFIINKKNNKYLKIFYTFLSGFFILSLFEAIAGYLIEFIFDTVFWNYNYLKFNIGNYIALEMALIWGISSILVIYIFKPLIDKIVGKIPKYLTYSLTILFIFDLLLTLLLKH